MRQRGPGPVQLKAFLLVNEMAVSRVSIRHSNSKRVFVKTFKMSSLVGGVSECLTKRSAFHDV